MSPASAEERLDDHGILRFSSDGRTLEQAIREPLKNDNWHLIRRLKIAGIMSRAKDVAEWQRAWFIEKGKNDLDILEQRNTLTMYVYEIMGTRYWFGLQYHFPNLVVNSGLMEQGFVATKLPIPLKWHDNHGRAEDQAPKVASDSPPSTTTTTTKSRPSDPHSVSSIIAPPVPLEGGDSDSSTTPFPDDSPTNTAHNLERFRPSFSLHNNKPPTDPAIAQLARDSGVTIEPNYEGELTLATIRDRTCPADQNAAVYIKNVDPAWTTEEILDCIHEGGIHKYSRQKANEFYDSCAVTLTFKYRRAAVSFLRRARTEGIYIKGQEVDVVRSRHHCWGIEKGREKQSRVLQVEGPKELLDADKLEADLHNHISFTLVKREEWVEDGRKSVNFHFENIFGQSRAAVAFLAREEKYNRVLTWRYAADPCAINGN